jgi:uncharacterized membrane protein YoaK (UPF0700 family)
MAAAAAAWRPWLAVPLVAIAGYVDGIGWLRLQELFVSFMSGTSTMLGLALVDGPAGRAAVLALVVGLFTAGAVAGAVLGRLAGRWRAAAVLALVATLLALAWKLPWLGSRLPPAAYALVPAMGALNLALPGVGGITFVTGALTRFAEALVAALAGAGPHAAWLRQLAAWASLVGGAALGAAMEARLGQQALGLPVAAAALAAVVAAVGRWRLH